MSNKNILISLLQTNPKYQNLSDAISINADYYAALPFEAVVSAAKPLNIRLTKGLGKQSEKCDLNLDFAIYLRDIIEPIVTNFKQKHPNHPFDDRKFRLHDFFFKNEPFSSTLTLLLAPTSYQQFEEDSTRSKHAALDLMISGMKAAQDPYYYFAKILGLTIIVISQEGYVFLGERIEGVAYPNTLSFVGGTATFQEDLTNVNFFTDIKVELEEEIEYSVAHEKTDFQFIGIAGNPFTSELDLVFVLQSEKDKSFFENGTLTEHKRMICIQNKKQAISLLTTGRFDNETNTKTLLYPTRFGLNYLVQYHWKNL